MSVELAFIIVGITFILIAIGGATQNKETGEALIGSRLRIPVGLAGVLLIIYGGYSFGAINLQTQAQIEQAAIGNVLEVSYPVNRIQIISPLEGDTVECRVLTMGVYPENHGKDIWVLLKPSDDKYYPQSDHTNTSYKRNGKWQVITRFGGDENENFEIIAFEADQAASAFFMKTIEDWKTALEYPGLEETDLPKGAVEVDRILVSLKESCRGVF
jgi:hypothetical protein